MNEFFHFLVTARVFEKYLNRIQACDMNYDKLKLLIVQKLYRVKFSAYVEHCKIDV